MRAGSIAIEVRIVCVLKSYCLTVQVSFHHEKAFLRIVTFVVVHIPQAKQMRNFMSKSSWCDNEKIIFGLVPCRVEGDYVIVEGNSQSRATLKRHMLFHAGRNCYFPTICSPWAIHPFDNTVIIGSTSNAHHMEYMRVILVVYGTLTA